MQIQTFTIVAGSATCNAKCPYCVSRMTGKEIGMKEPEVNWRNFDKACRLAQISDVSTVLLTGKGEPTLFPEQLTKFLKHMRKYDFPLIELQTNALSFGKNNEKYLKKWYELGLNTIAIFIVHYKKEKNKQIFTPNSDYINLESVIKKLHTLGFSIRLSCVIMKDFVDNIEEVKKLAEFCKKNKVEQLTIRAVKCPEKSEDPAVFKWTKNHVLDEKQLNDIYTFIDKNAKKLMTFSYGAIVYDLNGQNICTSDCLTIKPSTDHLRQLIFFPDGHLRYDWQFKGAILV